MTGPKPMPNKVSANVGKFASGKSAGQFGDAITRILTMAQEHAIRALNVSTPVQANVVLRDATTLDARMHDEVFRILGVRFQLPEAWR